MSLRTAEPFDVERAKATLTAANGGGAEQRFVGYEHPSMLLPFEKWRP